MARSTIRTTTLSLDTISILKRLYPRVQTFWEKHLQETEINIQYFYTAMRSGQISEEVGQLIDSNLDYDLRHLGIDRDDLALIPEFTIEGLVAQMLDYMEGFPAAETEGQKLDLLVKLRVMSFILRNSGELGR